MILKTILFIKFVFLLLFLLTACDLKTQESSNCGGVEINDADYIKSSDLKRVLGCAGWLDYVIDNVAEIQFVNVSSFPLEEKTVLGQAFCSLCMIRISTLEKINIPEAIIERRVTDIARLIVHEAAHLADKCENGEAPALQAEKSFLDDFLIAVISGECAK